MKTGFFLLAAVAIGCDDHGHEGAHEESEVAVGCAHFEYGIDQLRTATEGETGPDSTLAAVHQRFVVTLPAEQSTLAFVAPSAGDYYLMLSGDVPLVLELAGADVPATERLAPVEDCAAAAVVYRFADLQPGTYLIHLGPTQATEVTLVPHLAGQDHEH